MHPTVHDAHARPLVLWIGGGLATLLLAIIAVFVVSLSGSDPTGTSRASSSGRALAPYWTVRRKDTYGSIAARTGLSVTQLEAFNRYQDPSAIRPGQRIKLRLHVPVARRRLGPLRWTIRPGDTFASIARRTGHSVGTLRRRNPRLDPGALAPGQRVTLRH